MKNEKWYAVRWTADPDGNAINGIIGYELVK